MLLCSDLSPNTPSLHHSYSLQSARVVLPAVVLQDGWSRTCEECRRDPSAGLNRFDLVRWASVINTEAHTCGGGDEFPCSSMLQPSFQASAWAAQSHHILSSVFQVNYGLLVWKAYSLQSYAWIIRLAWIRLYKGTRSKLFFWLGFVSQTQIRFLAWLWTAQFLLKFQSYSGFWNK